jgi:hypothetical protein
MSTVQLQSTVDPSFYRMLGAKEDGALLEGFTIRRPSITERLAAGKALRQKVPRKSHASKPGSIPGRDSRLRCFAASAQQALREGDRAVARKGEGGRK